MLITVDFLHLNEVLVKMVQDKKITAQEREDLLHKSGLIKLEDNRWQENENSILTLPNL
jgi:hypothetical protein